jgi:hypothetical protein
MMTSRAEYRLFLRQDNADERLTPIGHEIGLVSDEIFEAFEKKTAAIALETERLKKTYVAPTEELRALLDTCGQTLPKPGESLADLIAANPKKYDEYMEMFVDIQLDIQSRNCPLLSRLKDKMNRKIKLTELDDTTKYDLHTRLDGMKKHNKLCHGDYTSSNIIITPDNKPYILDWAHATQGNASADAARTYLTFCLEGNIAGAEKYLDLFCKKSNTAKKYVQSWMPIVAASQSVKKKDKEKDILLSWVNVVDYE